MIVVKIELWSARTREKSEIGRMYIANSGGTHKRGDYRVAVCHKGADFEKVPREIWPEDQAPNNPKAGRVGEVLNYPRLSYNVWRLISRALRSAFPEEE